jgi:hypothetical protein
MVVSPAGTEAGALKKRSPVETESRYPGALPVAAGAAEAAAASDARASSSSEQAPASRVARVLVQRVAAAHGGNGGAERCGPRGGAAPHPVAGVARVSPGVLRGGWKGATAPASHWHGL